MLVQSARVLENSGSKDDCLFAKNWVIIANGNFCQDLMCRAASTAPATSNNDKLLIIFLKRAYQHVSV